MVQQRVEIPRERPQYRQVSSEADAASLASSRNFKMATVALSQNGTGNTYVFAWQNPEDNLIIVTEVIVYLATASGAASTMDVAVVASATSNGDTIFDALNINQSAVIVSSQILDDTGTNGTERPRTVDENGGTNDWITGYEASGASYAALVGYVYIFYTEV